jgi:hypothetical protein
MATCDPSPTDLIARARPTLGDLRNWAEQVEGVVGLTREALCDIPDNDETVTRAWCSLDLALEKLALIRGALEVLDQRRVEA